MSNSLDDKTVVDNFVVYLRDNGHPNLKVDRRPDVDNRNSPDIDAIADRFAIEHTSIDSIANQRRDSAWFIEAVGELEDELTHKLRYRLNITLSYKGVQHGQNWPNIRKSFRGWIMNSSPTLPDGMHLIRNEPGIPFEFRVKKASDRRAGLFFPRIAPEDDSLPDRLCTKLDSKSQKLMPYKKKGYTTILLVESDDIALMNEDIMLEAIRCGFSRRLPTGVDHVWYADTSIPDELLFYDFTENIKK